MKKVFWKVLCILICCCVFSACGKSAGGSEPVLQEAEVSNNFRNFVI